MTTARSRPKKEILSPLVRSTTVSQERKKVFTELRSRRNHFLKLCRVLEGPQITITNHLDQDPCPSLVFEFIPQNQPSGDLARQDLKKVLFNRDYVAGCECLMDCSLDIGHSCSCIVDKLWHFEDGVEAVTFAYDEQGRVIDRILEETLPIYECTEVCACSMQCPNKVVMRGRQLPLEIFKTTAKGWGVRCTVAISRGTFVACYRGELLDPQGAERRGRNYDVVGQTYLFDLDEWNLDLEAQNIPMLTIDAYKKGDISRFFNHSCSPNLKSLPVTNGVPQEYEVAFFATTNIRAREELCFDYDPQWSQKRAEAAVTGKPFEPLAQCFCASPSCRQWIFCK